MRLIPLIATLALLAPRAEAQIRASELGSMSQTIDGTKLTVTYSRPRGRGRDPLFGSKKSVEWGETWTPGANWATTLEVDKPIALDGHAVKPGTYSLWMVVRESGDWTMILDPRARLYHMNRPDSTASQLRFPVKPHAAPYTDVLTWSMPELDAEGGALVLQWGKLAVSMHVDVVPSLTMTFPAAEAKDYIGTWEYTEHDSGAKAPPKVKRLVIDYENNTLKGRWQSVDGYFQHFALVRLAPDTFSPGIYDEHGRIYEVLRPDLVFEFARVNGQPATLEVREEGDHVWITGKRIR